MSSISRSFVVVIVLQAAFGAQAQDEEAPAPPAAEQEADEDGGGLVEGAVDTYGGVAFGGRIIGVPALLIGGTCLGTALHALVVAGALNTSGLGQAGFWTQFGGNIALAVSALPIIIGEIALGTGAFADALAAFDMTAAEADGTGMAWTRLALWELGAHFGALGAGLGVGGVLSIIAAIVLPNVFAFDAAGTAAYSGVFTLGLTTTATGAIAILVAAALAGISVWLDGATTAAYKKAARGTASSRALPAALRGVSASLTSSAMAY